MFEGVVRYHLYKFPEIAENCCYSMPLKLFIVPFNIISFKIILKLAE